MSGPLSPDREAPQVTVAVEPPAAPAPDVPEATVLSPSSPTGAPGKYIWTLVLSVGGVYIAFIAPLAISLAVRVNQLAPAHQEYLGYITGISSLLTVIAAPVIGNFSDRTRSRFGRRRPWVLAGALFGFASLSLMAIAPNVLVLGLGWALAQIGWGGAFTILTATQADKVAEHQRGRISALMGVATITGPVVGAMIAAAFVSDNVLMMLVPGALGLLGALAYLVFGGDPDSREMKLKEGSLKAVLSEYLFSPRQYPDFSWNFLSRLFFYGAVSFSTTFTLYFIVQRAEMSIEQASALAAGLSVATIAVTLVGNLAGGFLSDKFQRRRIFVPISALIFMSGCVTMALSDGLSGIIVGSLVVNAGMSMYGAVDSAIVLDILPERDTDAGRFMAINGLATTISQAIAPLLAPSILLIGVSGTDKNYSLLFITAAVFGLISGVIVMLRVKGVR